MNLWHLFCDPVLRAPMWGCTLMGIAAGLIGVIAFVQRRSLLGEVLSHAAYPGVVVAVVLGATLPQQFRQLWVLLLGGLSALGGMILINYLIHRLKIRADQALCFVLAVFFGIGVTLASRVQFSHAASFREVEGYLFGQAATMTDGSIVLYGCFTLLVIGCVVLFFKQIQVFGFDPLFAYTIGGYRRLTEAVTIILMTTAVMLGIRTVGMVLMSAMLVAPASTARQFSNRFSTFFLLSGMFGGLSGWSGHALASWIGAMYEPHLALPAGPISVLVSAFFCVSALLFAPKRGLVCRRLRILSFRYRCLQENVLKAMWRLSCDSEIPLSILQTVETISSRYLRFILHRLSRHGWVEATDRLCYRLTGDGKKRACRIVRLHRLWELYLAEHLGVGSERVHHLAEEMEHMLTPELERQLTDLLDDPTHDPHAQPIPPREVTV